MGTLLDSRSRAARNSCCEADAKTAPQSPLMSTVTHPPSSGRKMDFDTAFPVESIERGTAAGGERQFISRRYGIAYETHDLLLRTRATGGQCGNSCVLTRGNVTPSIGTGRRGNIVATALQAGTGGLRDLTNAIVGASRSGRCIAICLFCKRIAHRRDKFGGRGGFASRF